MHPLAGVSAKLNRASENLDSSDEKWRQVIDEHIHQLVVPAKLDRDSGWYEFQVGRFTPDLIPFAIRTGEVAYQLRSALEHLVWRLAKRSHRKRSDYSGFPIETKRKLTPEQFVRQHRNGYLRGVPVSAIKLIETYQPYHAPDPPAHFLALIKLVFRLRQTPDHVSGRTPPPKTQRNFATSFPSSRQPGLFTSRCW